MKKYEFTDETKRIGDVVLHRIKAVRDFGNVYAGDLGGWIEKERNLSHYDNSWVYSNAQVYDDAWVCDNAQVYGNAQVCGNSWVYDNARVYGDAWVCGDAQINKLKDILVITPIGGRSDTTTFFKTQDNNICVTCGCFLGTLDEFLERVKETHGENKHAQAYRLACELARLQIELEDKINE